jgi:hypothetical protein
MERPNQLDTGLPPSPSQLVLGIRRLFAFLLGKNALELKIDGEKTVFGVRGRRHTGT